MMLTWQILLVGFALFWKQFKQKSEGSVPFWCATLLACSKSKTLCFDVDMLFSVIVLLLCEGVFESASSFCAVSSKRTGLSSKNGIPKSRFRMAIHLYLVGPTISGSTQMYLV